MTTCTVTNLGDIDTEGSLLYAINQVNLGNCDSIAISSSASSVYDFVALSALALTSEDESEATAIQISSGTLDRLTGAISVQAAGAGYGISGSYGTRSITDSTGSITVNAVGNAYGIDSYYEKTDSTSDLTTSLTFDEMQLSLDVESTGSNAFGIRVLTIATGRSYDYYYGGNNNGSGISEISTGDITGHLTVKAAQTGYGIYAYGKGYYGNGKDDNGRSTSIGKATISIKNLSSEVEVTGETDAYGLYALGAYAYSNGGSGISEISMEELSGLLKVTAGTGSAYGIYANGEINGGYKTVVVKEAVYDEDGDLVSAEETAEVKQALILSGTVSVAGGTYATAVSGGTLFLNFKKDAVLDVTAAVDGNVTAIYGSSTTINAMDTDLSVKSLGTGNVTGINSSSLNLKSLSGSISMNAKGTGTAQAIYFSNGTLDGFTGSITVRSNGAGYGISGTLT